MPYKPYVLIPAITTVLLATSFFFMARSDLALLDTNADAITVQPATAEPGAPSHTALEQTILKGHLFGTVAVEKPAKTREQDKKLPDTRLNIKLLGTFTHNDETQASALIADGKQNSKRYFVNDQTPGNAELVAVHKSYVVLRRNGRDELLRFPRLSEQGEDSAQTLAATNQIANTPEPEAGVAPGSEVGAGQAASATEAVSDSNTAPRKISSTRSSLKERLQRLRSKNK